jgi:hypothetical protein
MQRTKTTTNVRFHVPLETALNRKIVVPGVEGEIVVSMTSDGLSFRLKGSQKEIVTTWRKVIESCTTPVNVPTFLVGEPFNFLVWIGNQIDKRKSKHAA